MIVFAILAVILLLLALILFLPLTVGIEYENRDGAQLLIVRLRLLGIPLKFKYSDSRNTEKKTKKADKKSKKPEEPKEKMTFSRFRKIALGIKKAYRESEKDISDILAQIRRKISVESVCFSLNFGLSNAAKTGIATGAAWASSSCILSVLDHMFGIKKMYLDVVPDFNREHFRLCAKSILRLKPVHIIRIDFQMIKIVNLFIEKMDIK